METGGFFINPAHVTVISEVQGMGFKVWVVGSGEEPFFLSYANNKEAENERFRLLSAVSRNANG